MAAPEFIRVLDGDIVHQRRNDIGKVYFQLYFSSILRPTFRSIFRLTIDLSEQEAHPTKVSITFKGERCDFDLSSSSFPFSIMFQAFF